MMNAMHPMIRKPCHIAPNVILNSGVSATIGLPCASGFVDFVRKYLLSTKNLCGAVSQPSSSLAVSLERSMPGASSVTGASVGCSEVSELASSDDSGVMHTSVETLAMFSSGVMHTSVDTLMSSSVDTSD